MENTLSATQVPNSPAITGRDIRRPIAVALGFTLVWELLILNFWGFEVFSAAKTQAQTVWALTCGVALGALIGAAVNFFVTGRLPGRAAAVASAAIFAIVLTTCTFLCFWIDHKVGLFGARMEPALFIAIGLVPAVLAAPVYGWLVGNEKGKVWSDKILGWAI
ncbi:MAG: hypothetical protein RIB80_03565 [Rhodospirillales bacterium]|tara:strand:+ start:15845 stop:16333 length:489 start_codon:yes stop_codon:yes gene_type:complete